MTFKPELLSPAGTIRNMRYAFAYGADAVYAGQPRYSLRVRNNDFTLANLEQGINEAHALGKQFYVASNIAPHNAKIKTYMRDIEPVIEMKPDALIMSDPGLIMMVRDRFPDQVVHLSVQANVVNYASAEFWYRQGIRRIILSRELSLEEIAQIREHCPDLEIETFVHGALCIAYSGRCLLSGYINKRDPNQGTCTNTCRWKYNAHEAREDDSGDVVPTNPEIWTPPEQKIASDAPTLGAGGPTDELFLLEEEGRPGTFMPAYEDEHGTYIMNSKDLRAIQHVDTLTRMGVHSLKIEGRTKSHYYVARTAQAYRQAIDDAAAGKPFDKGLMNTLENLAHRGYTEGFYRRHVHDEYQNYETGRSISVHQQFVAEVIERDGEALTMEVKNKFAVGDSVELMTPKGNQTFVLEHVQNAKNNHDMEEVPGAGYRVRIRVPEALAQDAEQYGLLMKNL
ncbi:tRNA 5-hydroxyuridine modification protein YegQ [Reinekea blandensis]|uniref:Peptidase, U32 family protein n=1 Tax=Reinekea blandensis MED297 TaxID=314283 RepID=A4BEP5_9GAMM|nr:tRNA 5-hydroxyuridine modification protein YegQ [Reinekea blandensis]EAR09472.1 peptidase, U32 family protein [Reinekea sp. MED297] [Reinekea blandensis MED297]